MANIENALRPFKAAAKATYHDLTQARIVCGQIHWGCSTIGCSPACIEAETEMWEAFAAYSTATDDLRDAEYGWHRTVPHPDAKDGEHARPRVCHPRPRRR
jgi:hypothetical protein